MKNILVPVVKKDDLRKVVEERLGANFMKQVDEQYVCDDPFRALLLDLANESEFSTTRYVKIVIDYLLGYRYDLQNEVIEIIDKEFSNNRYIIVEL